MIQYNYFQTLSIFKHLAVLDLEAEFGVTSSYVIIFLTYDTNSV